MDAKTYWPYIEDDESQDWKVTDRLLQGLFTECLGEAKTSPLVVYLYNGTVVQSGEGSTLSYIFNRTILQSIASTRRVCVEWRTSTILI